jgi:hypothetical protein
MTQRSEVQQRMLEYKSILTTWIAGKLFTFRETGLDGWIKRRMLTGDGSYTSKD